MLTDPSLYAHFPWCVKKCPYCDFNSHPVRAEIPKEDYISCLIRDWQTQQSLHPLSGQLTSVFFGGGTPSLFSADHFATLLGELPIGPNAEITMEANPGTMEHADFSAYRAAGINRLSLGAQTFNAQHLSQLGRIHQASDTRRAFDQARQGGFDNINIDLMWGLPGQTVAQALADLNSAIALAPEHISWYQLTIEAKTEFARRPPQLPSDDVFSEIEQLGLACLSDAGFERYEVSAFAQAHHRCQHNLNYWQFGDYYGIGAGAHGKISATPIVRTRKEASPRLYMRAPTRTHQAPVAASDLAVEYMMNVLRLIEGAPIEQLQATTGLVPARIEPIWRSLEQRGLVRQDRYATTPRGLRVLDSVVAEFIH